MTVGVETPNELMVVFSDTVSAGFDALQGSVNGVFGLLIALVVALTGIQWALSPNREVLASGFGKVLLIGAFAWLINDWQRLSETIYAGFLELGLTAGGGSLSREEFLNPGAILAQGWEIVKALGETPAPVDNPLDIVGNMADALILGLAMIGIMLAFAVLALQIIVSLLEFKIVTLGGFVLLPFGIWNKSAFLAERPLGYVVSSGLKVLALAIVVSGARTIFDQLQPSANPDIYEALTILVAAILLAMLALFIPNLASALVTGGPALGAGAALTGALAIGGAGALAGAGVAGAGAMAGGAAARLAGPARAAAGAGSGRPTAPTNDPGPGSSPKPSNDNPPPGGPRRPSGGAMTARPPSGAAGVSEPAPARRPQATSGAEVADGTATNSTSPSGQEGVVPGSPGRSPGKIAAEAQGARTDFHRAASRPATGASPPARSAALQAFFVANAGRGLLPSGETSGVLSPNLKTEES
ncbi:MAG: P-type conjugative transfer protein TrbL [Brevundimonas sp.]|uniref:P-type conjugative transfer protein TrbL n=1 Tax=Brevundimonas sp. TaxID=1871086 RepID=UPI0024874EB1|nr:P-type conjugative transfer protein TrbL [Brevundimonas sp.]MDI1326977.1 P-type conjugative transfer protein TrbL [Brevundimonas sp.]